MCGAVISPALIAAVASCIDPSPVETLAPPFIECIEPKLREKVSLPARVVVRSELISMR